MKLNLEPPTPPEPVKESPKSDAPVDKPQPPDPEFLDWLEELL